MLFVCGAALSGCQFIERDDKKDYRQIVATIHSVDDKKEAGFSSGERHIYKFDLLNQLSQQLQGRAPTEDATNAVLQSLIDRELLYIEIERMLHEGTLVWRDGKEDSFIDGEPDFTDINKLKKMRYDSIDQELKNLQRSILFDYDKAASDGEGQESNPAPSFPVRDPEVNEEDIPEEEWAPELARIPGAVGGFDKISLETEALSRFADNVIRIVEDGVKPYDKAELEAARKDFNEKILNKQFTELYKGLWDAYPITFLIGDGTLRQVQMELLQSYLVKKENITVSDAEVEKMYKSELETQMLNFSDASAYASSVSGSDLVLYRPNADYFYVKHILIPFNDAQTAKLNAYKARQPAPTQAQTIEYRDRLVKEIVAYPHPVGFEDYSSPTSADAIFNEVKAAVSKASAVIKDAERRFDDFIYLYNTDPGIFNYPSGYAVKKVLGQFEQATYMKEFEDGARDLWKNYRPGQMLDYYVVTDYGVHIMYYASDTEKNSVKQVGDYETPGEYTKIFDVYEKRIRSTKEGAAYGKWEQRTLNEYTQKDNYVKKYDNRIKSIWK